MQLVKSVVRAVELLDLFTAARPRLTLNELARGLQTNRATAHRYAYTLRHTHVLRYDSATGQYTLGPKALTLGSLALSGLPIIPLAEPWVERLVRDAQETVVLSIWDGTHPVIVVANESVDRLVRVNIRIGSRLDPWTTAQGMVFLAHLPEAEVVAPSAGSPHDIEEIRTVVRKDGIAVNNSRAALGFRTIAAPVFREEHVAAAMAVVGTSATIPVDADSELADKLRDTARSLSFDLAAHNGERQG